jgi:DNA damage-binding protein 1
LYQIDPDDAAKLKRVESGLLGGLIIDQPTLAFSNVYRRSNSQYVNSALVVQVVPTGVHLLEWDSSLGGHTERDKWDPKCLLESDCTHHIEIVSASVNSSQISLASSRGNLVLLRIGNNTSKLEEQKSVKYNTT